MSAALEALVSSLLFEGYALYPYTPGSAKNATPTPFGIVYPPAYAARVPSAFDHLRLECVLEQGAQGALTATARFLHPSGERHEATERRIEAPPARPDELGGAGIELPFEFDGAERIAGRLRLRAERLGAGTLHRVRLTIENLTSIDPARAEGMERGAALAASLISTHVTVQTDAGRFVSPLEREGEAGAAVEGCASVNTWPVLAAADDRAVLGAAIVLPDHPRIAPESRGNLFDNTEIEEALLLHVHALTAEEREQIAAQDPAVREMVERAAATTPEEMIALHGRLEEVEPARPAPHFAGLPVDPGPPAEPGHPNPGERELELDGVVFRKGAKVVLRPGGERDLVDRMLDGRTATIERLYVDLEDGAHIAVTVDDDPAQELFRETGRYLFFRAGEVEALER